MRSFLVFAIVVSIVFVAVVMFPPHRIPASEPADPILTSISPRQISNQADYPVLLYGSGFVDEMRLELGGAALPTRRIDDRHLLAIVPAGLRIPPAQTASQVDGRLLLPDGTEVGRAALTVLNDRFYPVPFAMVATKEATFVASPNTDELWVAPADQARPVRSIRVGDRPRALALHVDPDGVRWLVIAHEYDLNLWLLRTDDPGAPPRKIPIGVNAQDVAVDGHLAFVTKRMTDAVHVVDLIAGKEIARYPVGVDPVPVAVAGEYLVVGNRGSSDLTLVRRSDGVARTIAPGPGVSIVGGHTEKYSEWVMGGTAARDFAYSASRDVVFASCVGPNVGPNPDRMEVTHNGGISVIDVESGTFVRHVSMLRGIPQGLALDDERGLLFAADVATGRIVVFDVSRLLDPARAGRSIVAALDLPLSPDTLLMRPKEDFGVEGRSSVAVHTGPWALALIGTTLQVLERFTGRLTELETSRAAQGVLTVAHSRELVPLPHQRSRRLGEVVYFTDLGNSRMTCDGCHPEGHAGGLLFTKGEPMHIYRSPSLRGIRESPPYFTPAFFPSLEYTSEFVLGRNRFHNPDAVRREISALSLYQATLVVPPNPNLKGGFPAEITLPDGTKGRPGLGLVLFEGKGGCVTCHPPPMFTTDQDHATRRRTHEVGTAVTLPLRPEMQDGDAYDLPPPSLAGVWDNFPLLHSGAGGFDVVGGDRVEATHPFGLRRVLDLGHASGKHGGMHQLSEEETNDLLGFLLTL